MAGPEATLTLCPARIVWVHVVEQLTSRTKRKDSAAGSEEAMVCHCLEICRYVLQGTQTTRAACGVERAAWSMPRGASQVASSPPARVSLQKLISR